MYLLFYFCVPFVCVWLVLYRSRFVVVGFGGVQFCVLHCDVLLVLDFRFAVFRFVRF